MSVTVKYSCPECGLVDREVRVTSRTDEDVVAWLEDVCMVEVTKDHVSVSPDCVATSLKDLKIPLAGVDKIGGAVLQ